MPEEKNKAKKDNIVFMANVEDRNDDNSLNSITKIIITNNLFMGKFYPRLFIRYTKIGKLKQESFYDLTNKNFIEALKEGIKKYEESV